MSLDIGTLVGYLDIDPAKFEGVLDKLPDKIKGSGVVMGAAAVAVAAGIGAALSSGIEQGMDMSDVNAKIGASMGLAGPESARLGAIAGKLYSQAYGESVEDVSKTVQNVITSIKGMEGASDETVSAMAAKFLNFNTAFEVDTARSTQIVGQLLKSGLVKDADEAVDLLTKTMQKVPANVREDILDAADEYAPFFAAIGMDGSEAFNLLAAGADKGMYGIDKAGDAVKEFGIRATDIGDTGAQAALESLGLSGQDMANQLLAGGDTAAGAFDTIVAGLQGITDPAAQAAAATALFGTPLEDLGKDQIPTFLASLSGANDVLGETKGAADAMGESLNGSAKTSWEQMSRTWDSIIGKAGAALIPALQAITSWANENPAVLEIIAVAMGVLAAAFVGVTVATWAMNTALLANPITWIVIGIVALIAALVLLIANWDSVVAFLGDAWAGFVGWFTGVMDGFLGWWGGVWDGFIGFLTDAWNGAISWLASIPGMILDGLAALGQMLIDLGMSALSGLATAIALGLMAVVYYFTQFPTDVLNALIGFGSWLIQTGVDLLTGLYNDIVTGWNATMAWFTALPQNILNFLISAAVWLITTGQQILAGLQNGINAGWTAVVSFFTSLPGRVLGFLAAAGSWLVATGSSMLSGLLNGINSFWGNIISFFQNLPGNILGFFGDIGSWLYSAGTDLISGLLNGIQSMAGSIGSFFLSLLPSWIVGPFKTALGIASPSKVFKGYGRNIAQGLVLGVDAEQDAVSARMASLVEVPDGVDEFGAQRGAGGRSGGTYASSNLTINGNVGWDAEEVARQLAERQRQAAALADLEEVGVA